MSSQPSTVNEATLAPLSSTILHSLFCGVFSTGDGVEYTGLLGSVAAVGMPGLLVVISSDRNRLCAVGATDGDGAEVAEGEEVGVEVAIGDG